MRKIRLPQDAHRMGEPCLEHPDYFPPKRIRDGEDTLVDDDSQRCFCDAWHDADYVWLRSSFS